MTWPGVMRLRRLLRRFKSTSFDDGGHRPLPRPILKPPQRPRLSARKMRSLLMSSMGLWLICSGCSTKPLLANASSDRPCYQWLITKDQEVYVYENGSLIARLETEPYDAVISGWCVMRNNEHLMNDIRRLSQ